MEKISGRKKGILYVAISALGFSIIPILATLGFSADMAAGTMLFYRFLIAFFLFLIYCLVKREPLLFQEKKSYACVLGAGAIYTVQCTLYFSAFQYISAAVGEIIFYIYTVFVAILSVIFLKEGITKFKVIGIITALFGIGTILNAPGGGVQARGVILVVISAMACAGYFIFNKKFTSEISTPVLMTYICAVCCVLTFLFSLFRGELTVPDQWSVWVNIGILAVWSTVIGLFCLMKGLKLLEAGMASLVSLSEPIFTITLSYLILRTALTPVQLAGAAIVIAAIAIYDKKQTPSAEKAER